jgi:hypothetical protein
MFFEYDTAVFEPEVKQVTQDIEVTGTIPDFSQKRAKTPALVRLYRRGAHPKMGIGHKKNRLCHALVLQYVTRYMLVG